MDISNNIGFVASDKNSFTMDQIPSNGRYGATEMGNAGEIANIIRLMQNPMYNDNEASYEAGEIFSSETILKCPKCEYRCSKSNVMEDHMSTHSDEKPFACTECDYRCSLKYNLKQHMFTHSNLWRFSCTKCNYKCRQKEHLKQHMMKHSGDKPYACTECEYRSLRKGDLKKHMKIHERRVQSIDNDDGFNNPASLLGYLGTVLKSTQLNSTIPPEPVTGYIGSVLKSTQINNTGSPEPVATKEILVERILSKFRQSQSKETSSIDFLDGSTQQTNQGYKYSDSGHATENENNPELIQFTPFFGNYDGSASNNNSESIVNNETTSLVGASIANGDIYADVYRKNKPTPSTVLVGYDEVSDSSHNYDRSQDQGVDEYIAEQLADTCIPLTIKKAYENPYNFDKSNEIHRNETSEDDPFKKLEYLFSPKKSLNQDYVDISEMKDNGTQEYDCNFCDYKCSSHTDFVLHVRSHTNKKIYECEKCDFKTSEHYKFKQHTFGHSADDVLSCTLCEYKCKQKNQLIEHMMNHRGDKPFQCPCCAYTCLRKGDLKRHILIHKGERPFKCPECNNRFKRSNHLKRHLEIHAAKRSMVDQRIDTDQKDKKVKESKQYACEECSYTCGQKVSLVEHMMNHRGEKPHACNICEYKGVRRGDLNKHMLTHTGNKPFACSECSFTTARRAHLNRHILTHAEKGLDCVICSVSFQTEIELKYHLLTHFSNNSGFSDDSSDISNESSTSILDNATISDVSQPFPFNNLFR